MLALKEKVVLVTGASRGIGRAIVAAFGAAGATVIGTATGPSGVEVIKHYYAEKGIAGAAYTLDICNVEQREACLVEIQKKFGPVQILVNNAGITRDNLVLRMQQAEWLEVLETNLQAVFFLMQKALRPMLKARWGRIINISSVVALTGNPGQANYCAAKAGLIGMTKACAHEVAARGITVNVIAPGFIETDMTQALAPEHVEAMRTKIPMQCFGMPEDIAGAALYLASDAARYMTGQTLHINGGMVMP